MADRSRELGRSGRSEAVDAYLAAQPSTHRPTLEALREQVHRLIPDAEEGISYGFPAFNRGGKAVVWIAGWKKHISLYPVTDTFLAAHGEAAAPYAHGAGTLRFSPDAPPPPVLIEALVRSRLQELG